MSGRPGGTAIVEEGAWGRISPTIAGAGAFYLMVKNTGSGEDKLTAVKSPACSMTEVHETVKNADGSMGMNLALNRWPFAPTDRLNSKAAVCTSCA